MVCWRLGRGKRMADLLDRIREELNARLSELRALVEEHERLDAALRALDADRTASSGRTSVSTAPASRRRGGAPTGKPAGLQPGRAAVVTPAAPRKRARRGANREAVLRAARERPGASSGELAVASGVERSTLHTLLARLVKAGELEKRTLPTGRTGYALSARAAGDGATGNGETGKAGPAPSGGAAA